LPSLPSPFGSPSSYLDRVIAAGYDGAFLDIVDAFEYYRGKRPQAAEEMIDFGGRETGIYR